MGIGVWGLGTGDWVGVFYFLMFDKKLKFWRTKVKSEVDFVYEKTAFERIAIEVKSTIKFDVLPKSFVSFIEKYDIKRLFV
ncbi:MAG: hypothetical protein ACOCXG_00210 [Nanoarchaeota archaeon]